MSAKDLNFRKTALKKEGSFKPARKGAVAGVGIATVQKPIIGKQGK